MTTPLLEVAGLDVAYGAIAALHEATLEVGEGEIVALLGANGAGKSTLLKALMGLQPVRAGTIRFDGSDITGLSAERRARMGIGYSPEGRRVFPGMTVRENLEVACPEGADVRAGRLNEVFGLFPALAERPDARGWQLSGGQQQMLAIGRALVARPRLLLLDEPSLGLSPILVGDVLKSVGEIAKTGTAVLLAEQNVAKALAIGDRAYVLKVGRITRTGAAAELHDSAEIQDAFLGGG